MEMFGFPHTPRSSRFHVRHDKTGSGSTVSKPSLTAFIYYNITILEALVRIRKDKVGKGFVLFIKILRRKIDKNK